MAKVRIDADDEGGEAPCWAHMGIDDDPPPPDPSGDGREAEHPAPDGGPGAGAPTAPT